MPIVHEVTKTMCGRCPFFEANGTPFGGKCVNKNSKFYTITVSAIAEFPCHPNTKKDTTQ